MQRSASVVIVLVGAASAFDRPDPLGAESRCPPAQPERARGARSDAQLAPPPGEAVDSDWDVDAGPAARPRSTAVRTGSGSRDLHDATAPPSGFDQRGRYSRVEARSTMRMTGPEPWPRLASRDERDSQTTAAHPGPWTATGNAQAIRLEVV